MPNQEPLSAAEQKEAQSIATRAIKTHVTWNEADKIAGYLLRALAMIEGLQAFKECYKADGSAVYLLRVERDQAVAERDQLRAELAAERAEAVLLKEEIDTWKEMFERQGEAREKLEAEVERLKAENLNLASRDADDWSR